MTPAPRGVIYDRNGVALVTNRTSLTVLADAEVANDRDVLLRLSALLGLPYGVVRQRAQDTTGGAQSQRVIASDVDLRNIAFISEHQDAFPGVTTEARTDRIYPYGALAAHALGYVQTVSESDLENMSPGQELEMGDMVGRSGRRAVLRKPACGRPWRAPTGRGRRRQRAPGRERDSTHERKRRLPYHRRESADGCRPGARRVGCARWRVRVRHGHGCRYRVHGCDQRRHHRHVELSDLQSCRLRARYFGRTLRCL